MLTVSGIPQGKYYNRAVSAHKTVFEAMSRLYWESLRKWLDNSTDFHVTNPGSFDMLQDTVNSLVTKFEIKDNVLHVDNEEARELVKVPYLIKLFAINIV